MSPYQTKYNHSQKGRANTARYKRTPKGRFNHSRYSAKTRGLTWTLTLEHFIALDTGVCHYCGLPIHNETGSALDRKDSSEGYEPHNVVPACRACNLAKSSIIPYEEMVGIVGPLIRRLRLESPEKSLLPRTRRECN